MQAGGCRFDAGRFHQFKQRITQPLLMGVWQRGSSRGAVTPVFFGRSLVQIQSHPPPGLQPPCSAVGSALALGAWGRQFEPGHGDQDHALLTQLARVLPCLGRSQRFESAAGRQHSGCRVHISASITCTQRHAAFKKYHCLHSSVGIERLATNQKDGSSNLSGGSINQDRHVLPAHLTVPWQDLFPGRLRSVRYGVATHRKPGFLLPPAPATIFGWSRVDQASSPGRRKAVRLLPNGRRRSGREQHGREPGFNRRPSSGGGERMPRNRKRVVPSVHAQPARHRLLERVVRAVRASQARAAHRFSGTRARSARGVYVDRESRLSSLAGRKVRGVLYLSGQKPWGQLATHVAAGCI